MFSWATQQLEKLSQTVAPPPEDPAGRFVYACQKHDTAAALEILQSNSHFLTMDTIVIPNKQQTALHVACANGEITLVQHLLLHPPAPEALAASLARTDVQGNTALHAACLSGHLPLVQLLVQHYQAPVHLTNASQQTPYDVATLNAVRQYLLPIQLQRETQHALENGGKGLPPGIDLGGLRIQNSHLPPPPSSSSLLQPPDTAASVPGGPINHQHQQHGMSPYPQQAVPPPSAYSAAPASATTTSPQQVTNTPPTVAAPSPASSDSHEYARTGHSSLAVYQRKSGTVYKPDGFHSSSSDKNLQKKYGHSATTYGNHVPPPPTSGNSSAGSIGLSAQTAPNNFSAFSQNNYSGAALRRPGQRTYVAYDPVTGQQQQQIGTSARYTTTAAAMTAPHSAPPSYTTFTPPFQSQQQQQQHQPYGVNLQQPYNQPNQSGASNVLGQTISPVSNPSPTTTSNFDNSGNMPDQPPPPYSSGANPAGLVSPEPKAANVFATPSPGMVSGTTVPPAKPLLQRTPTNDSNASDVFGRPPTEYNSPEKAPLSSVRIPENLQEQVVIETDTAENNQHILLETINPYRNYETDTQATQIDSAPSSIASFSIATAPVSQNMEENVTNASIMGSVPSTIASASQHLVSTESASRPDTTSVADTDTAASVFGSRVSTIGTSMTTDVGQSNATATNTSLASDVFGQPPVNHTIPAGDASTVDSIPAMVPSRSYLSTSRQVSALTYASDSETQPASDSIPQIDEPEEPTFVPPPVSQTSLQEAPRSASDVFSQPLIFAPPVEEQFPSVPEEATEHEEESELQDVPLSPDVQRPPAAANPASQNAMFAAIGMPPPPFSNK